MEWRKNKHLFELLWKNQGSFRCVLPCCFLQFYRSATKLEPYSHKIMRAKNIKPKMF